MPLHLHPRSSAPIQGVRLGRGAKLLPRDCYDSTNGTWQECPCSGLQIMSSLCPTIWIRPTKQIEEMSQGAQNLLQYLVREKQYLVPGHWSSWAVSSIPKRLDPRIDLRIKNDAAAQELIGSGLVTEVSPGSNIYWPVMDTSSLGS